MPSQQMGPRPMNMGFGGGMPSFGGNPFGGFGGGMPQMSQMPQMQPPQQFGAQPNFTGYGGPQAPIQQPSGSMMNAITCGPMPGMGGGAMGAGKGKGRTGPGMSGGFSGGMPGQPAPPNMNGGIGAGLPQNLGGGVPPTPRPASAPPQVSSVTPLPAGFNPASAPQTMNINDQTGPAVIPWS